jgi:mono/diheme cytochrome c family protein
MNYSVLRLLGRATFLAAASLVLTATAATAQAVHDEYHPAPRDTLDNDTYQGWKQFELNCSRCHGEYGVGTTFAPALIVSLKNEGTVPTIESFITTVCAGDPTRGCRAGAPSASKWTRSSGSIPTSRAGQMGRSGPADRQ